MHNLASVLNHLTGMIFFRVGLDFRSWWKHAVKSGLSVYHVRLASHRGSGQNAPTPPLVTDMMKVGKLNNPSGLRLFDYLSKCHRIGGLSRYLAKIRASVITAVSYEILP